MDGGSSNSTLYLISYLFSLLDFIPVQEDSQSMIREAIVKMADKCFLYIRASVIDKYIIRVMGSSGR